MTTLVQFKESYSFTQVAAMFGFHFSPHKTNICPVCHKNTFSIFSNDKRYKCFRPACELNTAGDIFNFLEKVGVSSSFKESMALLHLETSYRKTSSNSDSIFDQVFKLYREEFTNNAEAQEYLVKRGYDSKKFEVGYAPDNPYYLSNHFQSLTELTQYSLIKEDGTDYLRQRLVFPIRNLQKQIVHFHSRDLSGNSELRWLASKKRDTSNIDYLWRGHIEKDSEALFLTEGISDALSLVNWDIPVVATMSIQANITELLKPFSKLEELHCIFDNDRQSINNGKYSYTFKSWEFILPKLIQLKLSRPDLQIYCFMPPTLPNVKDLNDYSLLISKTDFQNYYAQHTLSLCEFVYTYFLRPDYYSYLIKLSYYDSSLKYKLLNYVSLNYNTWLDFIHSVE